MTRSRYSVLCALIVIGAFAGGYAAGVAVPVAHAQEPIRPLVTNIRGTSFTLVNPQGQVQATLRGGAIGAELILDDANGNPRIEIGASGITIRDAMGRMTWKSPKAGFLPAVTE